MCRILVPFQGKPGCFLEEQEEPGRYHCKEAWVYTGPRGSPPGLQQFAVCLV